MKTMSLKEVSMAISYIESINSDTGVATCFLIGFEASSIGTHVWFYKFGQEPFAREVFGCREKSFTTAILNSPFATLLSKTPAYTQRPVLC